MGLLKVQGQSLPQVKSLYWDGDPVEIDGYISDDAWDDPDSVLITLVYDDGVDVYETDAWVIAVNDKDYVYFYGGIEFPIEVASEYDLIGITFLWGDVDSYGFYEFGDSLDLDTETARTWDYFWDDESSQFIDDSDYRTSGRNDVKGVAYYDGEDYWFEIRKPLNSGDGCDWNFEPGELYGIGNDWLALSFYCGLVEDYFHGQFSLALAPVPILDITPKPFPLEYIAGIVALVGAVIGIVYKIRDPLKEQKRKDVYNEELKNRIDSTYDELKNDAIKCIEKLEKMKEQITKDFNEEFIKPEDYQKLIKRINDYMVVIDQNG